MEKEIIGKAVYDKILEILNKENNDFITFEEEFFLGLLDEQYRNKIKF